MPLHRLPTNKQFEEMKYGTVFLVCLGRPGSLYSLLKDVDQLVLKFFADGGVR